jgi:magnesium-protoporphyrin IX monomethyl ester (oxidative) cyclase
MTVASSAGNPLIYPPLGIMYIASVLEESGYEVALLDCQSESCGEIKSIGNNFEIGLPYDEIESRIKDFAPDVIGISCNFSVMVPPVNETVKAAKKVLPEVPIVVGGCQPTSMPREMMENEGVDFVIMGEGERNFLKLVKAIEAGDEFSDIAGVAWKDSIGDIHVNPQGDFIEDLDSLPYPAWHLFPYEKYSRSYDPQSVSWGEPEGMPSILTTRGCSATCIFCSVHKTMGRKFRTRSLEDVFQEIRYLIDTYHIKQILVIDDNFTQNKKRAKEFCDEFKKQNFGIKIHFLVLALWCMDEELIDKLQSIGTTKMGFAIESGVQDVITNIIKKPLKLPRAMELLRYAKSKGIHLTGTFVLGFPGETKKDMQRSLYMANYSGLFDNREVYIATPLPGSELYKSCEDGGYFTDGFSYDNIQFARSSIETEEFSAEYMDTLVEADRTHHLMKTYPKRIFHYIGEVRRRKPNIFFKVLIETARMFIKYDILKYKEEYP